MRFTDQNSNLVEIQDKVNSDFPVKTFEQIP